MLWAWAPVLLLLLLLVLVPDGVACDATFRAVVDVVGAWPATRLVDVEGWEGGAGASLRAEAPTILLEGALPYVPRSPGSCCRCCCCCCCCCTDSCRCCGWEEGVGAIDEADEETAADSGDRLSPT